MILWFTIDLCQVTPEQMLWPIAGWYTDEALWDIFYNKVSHML